MTTLKKLRDDLTELEQRILELVNNGDPDLDQLSELEAQAQWLKAKLKIYFSLRAAFDALPENGAGEAYGDLLDQMEDVKAAISRRVSSLKMIERQQTQILTHTNSPTERV